MPQVMSIENLSKIPENFPWEGVFREFEWKTFSKVFWQVSTFPNFFQTSAETFRNISM